MKANKTRFKQLPQTPQVLPTECLDCGSKTGYTANIVCNEVAFRKEVFEVEYTQFACAECDDAILSDTQMTERTKKLVAAYQMRHGLLTAHQLSSQRKAMGFNSQRTFLKAAPQLPEATLKRIEGGLHAQDASTDALFRKELERLEDQMMLNILNQPMPEATVTMIEPTKVYNNGWDLGTFAKAACITTAATFSVLCTSRTVSGNASPQAAAHKTNQEQVLC
jgi:hypothetical protein